MWVLSAMTCKFENMIKASGKSWKAHHGRHTCDIRADDVTMRDASKSYQTRAFRYATVCQPWVAAVTWCDVSLLRIARVFLGRRSNGVYFCATRHGSHTGFRIIGMLNIYFAGWFHRLFPQACILTALEDQNLLHDLELWDIECTVVVSVKRRS